MDICSRGSESTGLLDYVSYKSGYSSAPQRASPREEEDFSTVEPVTRRPLELLHSVLVLMILAASFLFVLIYFAMPVVVHVCLQNKCYFSLSSHKEDKSNSSNDTNITISAMDGGAGQWLKAPPAAAKVADGGNCEIPAKSFPSIPVFPANYSIDSIGFCYGQNNTDISLIEACTGVLAQTKELMGYHNVSSNPLSKIILGLSGKEIQFYLQIALGMLFNYVAKEWPDCEPYAKPTICQYLFPPVIDNKNLILAVNHSSCLEARDDHCKVAWKEADKQISNFVARCNKTYPILNMLHMPRCKQMPKRSLMEAPSCVFSGVKFSGKTCHNYWQYSSTGLSHVSLGLQDLFFIATWIIAVALTLMGFILPFTISRLTFNVFPYFSMMVVSGVSLVYALFLTVVYLSYSSRVAESALFCPSAEGDSLAAIVAEGLSTGFCKTSAYLFHVTALSIASVWMYNLILATVRLTNQRDPPPSTLLRSSFSVFLAVALGALALLPSIISALDGTVMVFPRRPTVICVEKDEGREFFSFILPLAVMLLVGTAFIIYILYKTLESLSTVRGKAVLDRSFGSLQFYPLKPQLRVLLFHLLVGIFLLLMLTLAVSSRLSALLFKFDILPIGGKSLETANGVPFVVLLVGLVIGVFPYLTFVVMLMVEWAITAWKIK